jgi:hypothetical protein
LARATMRLVPTRPPLKSTACRARVPACASRSSTTCVSRSRTPPRPVAWHLLFLHLVPEPGAAPAASELNSDPIVISGRAGAVHPQTAHRGGWPGHDRAQPCPSTRPAAVDRGLQHAPRPRSTHDDTARG